LNILTPGLGLKIFDAVNDVLKDKADLEVFKSVDSIISGEWNRVGANIVAWCCSGSRLYSA
jgi:hypothetical protein